MIKWKNKYYSILNAPRYHVGKWEKHICFFCKKTHKRLPKDIDINDIKFFKYVFWRYHFCALLLNIPTPKFITELAERKMPVHGSRTFTLKKYKNDQI